MNEYLKIFLSSALIDNVVFIQFLALCPFIGMTADVHKSNGMGVATSFVMVLATVVTYPLYHFVLLPLDLAFLQTLVFILVIASLVQLVEYYLKKSAPALYSSMGVYLALITTNCAILAVTLKSISKGYNFLESIVYSLGTAVGFTRNGAYGWYTTKSKTCKIPAFIKGTPVLFVAAGLLSMAFSGFSYS